MMKPNSPTTAPKGKIKLQRSSLSTVNTILAPTNVTKKKITTTGKINSLFSKIVFKKIEIVSMCLAKYMFLYFCFQLYFATCSYGKIVIMLKNILASVLILILPAYILADSSELNLNKEKINPGSSLYVIKRLTEKIQGTIIFSQERKVAFHDNLVRKRLSELNYLVENKKVTPIEQASYRLSAQAGVSTDELLKLNKKEENEKILKWFSLYKTKLSELRDNYPANSSNWLLLQQNIDTLNLLTEKLR